MAYKTASKSADFESMKIAKKNDLCRTTFMFCKVLLTRAVANSEHKEQVLTAVRYFDGFDSSNDPYGEHDFGAVIVNGAKYFFKFDYYDENYEFYKEDGNRVLTIMRADEY